MGTASAPLPSGRKPPSISTWCASRTATRTSGRWTTRPPRRGATPTSRQTTACSTTSGCCSCGATIQTHCSRPSKRPSNNSSPLRHFLNRCAPTRQRSVCRCPASSSRTSAPVPTVAASCCPKRCRAQSAVRRPPHSRALAAHRSLMWRAARVPSASGSATSKSASTASSSPRPCPSSLASSSWSCCASSSASACGWRSSALYCSSSSAAR
mmetsp:Transcript_121415/g.348888  ORF Transcript_121415/g.348888 Transcript_121415/m.348888 type:complete len:211 (-) Transcript_121415:393-1025(-)